MMRVFSVGLVLTTLLGPLSVGVADAAAAIPWAHPLYLGNNEHWRQRIPVVVRNDSDLDLTAAPVQVAIGTASGQVPLVGQAVESFRMANAKGDQLMFRVVAPDGAMIEKGPAPKGARLIFPLECPPGDHERCFVYFDNPAAWPVGDYFLTTRDIANGGFETEGRDGPRGWNLPWPEHGRSVRWTDDEAHSGRRSLQLTATEESDDPEPDGARQVTMHLVPGVTYSVEAWMKGEAIRGRAGLRLSTESQALEIADFHPARTFLVAEEGSTDWTRVNTSLVAPQGATVLRVETFQDGTGTLWIDDIRVRSDVDYGKITVAVQEREPAPVVERGVTDGWFDDDPTDGEDWPVRTVVKVANFSERALPAQPIHVDLEQILNRLHAELGQRCQIQVTDGVRPLPSVRRGNAILFRQDIPAATIRTYHLYLKPRGSGGSSAAQESSDAADAVNNLVANGDFEQGGEAGWVRFGDGMDSRSAVIGEKANHVARIEFLTREADNETGEESKGGCGLSQEFAVQPGRTHFFGVRVKGSDLLKHAHAARAVFKDATGQTLGGWHALSFHQDRYLEPAWRDLSMSVDAPARAASVEIKLTRTGTGTVWFDDVVFGEAMRATTSVLSLERKAAAGLRELAVWTINPIVKVFPDDLPGDPVKTIRISAARNESEPVQLAFRTPVAMKGLEIRVTSPRDADGHRLNRIEVGTVGYVPIDAPSTYYHDDTTPYWRLRTPRGRIGSDGWAGWWPDPILPSPGLDLPAHETHAAWIDLHVPAEAPPGEYRGQVQLVHEGQVLRRLPLEVRVRTFQLPEAASVEAVYDVRFRNRQRYGHNLTEQEQYQAVWRYMKAHRLNPETIRPQPRWTVKDGEVTADFSEFDKAAAYYFDELKFQMTYTPWEFFLFGWAHPPRDKFGQAPYPGEPPFEDADRSQLRPEFKRVYQSALKLYWEHMKARGWADKVIMYISDEPMPEPRIEAQMKALCDMIHEVDPEIPIYVSVWWYRPEFEGYLDVWGVSHRGGAWGRPVPVEHLQRIVRNGDQMIFTTDGMQCTDTPYLAFERLLPHFCFKYGARMYEFWGSNWQTINPYDYGWHPFHRQSNSPGQYRWIRYPNGDGYCIYPGPAIGVDHLVASIRLRQAREGVEDYEYLALLRKLIAEGKAEGRPVAAAEHALARAQDLVTIPTGDGRYSTAYLQDPDQVLTVRDAVGDAIESLTAE